MNRLKLEIEAALDGQPPIAYNDPDMSKLLEEIRAVTGRSEDQRVLGTFVLSLITARLKAGLKTERVIQTALGARGGNDH